MDGDIAYRETVAGAAEVRHSHMKQTGGAGEFADVSIRVEPIDHALGVEFVNAIEGNAVPREFISGVEAGVREAAMSGAAVGFPVLGVRVTLLDGRYHEMDSNEATFRIAARDAFRQANAKARPVLLEPVIAETICTIAAMIPEANLFGHAETLAAITEGRASASVAFDHYQPVPRGENDPNFPGAAAARVA